MENPLMDQVNYNSEVPKESSVIKCTYFLPVGSLSGLRSWFLKYAKKSSMGLA